MCTCGRRTQRNKDGSEVSAEEPRCVSRIGGPVILLLDELVGVPVDVSAIPRAAEVLDALTAAADRAQRACLRADVHHGVGRGTNLGLVFSAAWRGRSAIRPGQAWGFPR